jgi:hypothetical protein
MMKHPDKIVQTSCETATDERIQTSLIWVLGQYALITTKRETGDDLADLMEIYIPRWDYFADAFSPLYHSSRYCFVLFSTERYLVAGLLLFRTTIPPIPR